MQDEAVEIVIEEQIASASDVKDLVADKFIGTRDFQQPSLKDILRNIFAFTGIPNVVNPVISLFFSIVIPFIT